MQLHKKHLNKTNLGCMREEEKRWKNSTTVYTTKQTVVHPKTKRKKNG